jgi:hypothetical protein
MGSRELRHTSADLDYRYAFGDLLVVRDAPLALENYRFLKVSKIKYLLCKL